MTVQELIQLLKRQPLEAEVVCLLSETSYFPYSVEEAQHGEFGETVEPGDVVIFLNDC